MNRIPEGYADCWTPIESNPEIFTELAQSIGLSKSLAFEDIWGLDSDSIALLPRPVLAVVLVFPTGENYEQNVAARNIGERSTTDDSVVWFKQTIHNACGLYGLLHAVCNGDASKQILPGTLLSNILSSYSTTQPAKRSSLLLTPDLKDKYLNAAHDGDSTVPENAADEVDFHYTCFVKSNGHLYDLNGDLSGPDDLGPLKEDEDVLSDAALGPIRRFMQANGGDNISFSMLALVPNLGN